MLILLLIICAVAVIAIEISASGSHDGDECAAARGLGLYRVPLAEQLDERLLARAKAEKDWHTIAPLKATADLIRWTIANADTLKAADAVVRHPVVRAVLQALPGAEISAIRQIEPDAGTPRER